MSSISGVGASAPHHIRQASAPPPPPARQDHDGDEASESAAAKASEASQGRALNVTA